LKHDLQLLQSPNPFKCTSPSYNASTFCFISPLAAARIRT
jgi:hypothetical protein